MATTFHKAPEGADDEGTSLDGADGASSTDVGSARNRGGRPSALQWVSAGEAAELLSVSLDQVMRVLSLDRARASFFPHARRSGAARDGDWKIPVRDLRALGLSKRRDEVLEPLLRMGEFAALMRIPRKTIAAWVAAGTLAHVDLLGLGIIRIPADEYWRMRECPQPKRGPRARSFFSGGGSAA